MGPSLYKHRLLVTVERVTTRWTKIWDSCIKGGTSRYFDKAVFLDKKGLVERVFVTSSDEVMDPTTHS